MKHFVVLLVLVAIMSPAFAVDNFLINGYKIKPVEFANDVNEGEGVYATDAVNSGAISIYFGTNVTTQYFFRGQFQENEGLIMQPYFDMQIALVDIDNVGRLSAYVGVWNSFHTSDDTGTGAIKGVDNEDPQFWFESDFYAGLVLETGVISFGVLYQIFTSPNDVFETIEEVNFSIKVNDQALTGLPFAINPSILVAVETNNRNDGDNEGIYMGIALAPAFDLGMLSLSLPTTVGFSLHDYFEDEVGQTGGDDFFGFVRTGLQVTVPLTCIPEIYGQWAIAGQVEALFLADNLSEENQASNQDFEVIATIGIHTAY